MAGWKGERESDGGEPERSVTTTEVARSERGRQSLADMVRSLLLIAVAIGVTLIFVPGLLHPSKSQHFPAADYQDYLVGFRQLTGVPALVPLVPPAQWRANAAALTSPQPGVHLHIGWVAPGAKYVELEESVGPSSALISTVLGARGSAVTGHMMVNGRPWLVRTSDRGEYALSGTTDGVNVVITGSGSSTQMRDLAATLQPASNRPLPQPSARAS